MPSQNPQDARMPAPKKLTLTKETLRRLTPTELRLVAGGEVPVVTWILSTCTR